MGILFCSSLFISTLTVFLSHFLPSRKNWNGNAKDGTSPKDGTSEKDCISRQHLRNEGISVNTMPLHDQTAKTTPPNDQTAQTTPPQKEPFWR
jgi:hypothetical protein